MSLVGDNGGDDNVGWRWCKSMMGEIGGGRGGWWWYWCMGEAGGGIGVWVGLVVATMVGGDGGLVVCDGGGGCGWWFATVVGRVGGSGGAL
ncbi:hypothetical protein Tco_1133413 [Tanacetum coccineum]